MDQTTISLATAACGIHMASLPAAVVHECKRRIIDSIACALGAFDETFSASIRGFAGRTTSQPGARIWGSGERSSIEMAGFANATMVRYLDLNDTHLGKTAGHPSDMIAGLCSLAEANAASGPALIEGIVAAYDLYCGLCNATPLAARALDQSTCAALGAAGGASRVLRLSLDETAQAISLALSANLNLYNVRTGTLSDWKACAGPNAARNGIFAAQLAAAGITGPTAVFEGRGGLFDAIGAFEMTSGPNLITDTHLKFHPVCYHGQSSVDVATALHSRIGLSEISGVEVETYETAVKAMAADQTRWAPTTRETADHSIPFTVGVALSTGRLTSSDYQSGGLENASLRALMAKIRVNTRDDFSAVYPLAAPARITVRTKDGKEFSAEQTHPKGHTQNRLSDGELETKLANLLPSRLEGRAARRLLDLAWVIDTADSVAPLIEATVFGPRP
jgi:2-methylcitrate dehydratase